MNGVPSLNTFAGEVQYLIDYVYGNPMIPVERADPLSNGTTQWKKMLDALKALPHTPIRAALFQAHAAIIQTRPTSPTVALETLQHMKQTILAVRACLKVCGKDDADEDRFHREEVWIEPAMEWMSDAYIQYSHRLGTMDGPCAVLEKQFYGKRGQQPLSAQEMHTLSNGHDTFGRVGVYRGGTVGHYMCTMKDKTLTVIDFAVVEQLRAQERGVPEFLTKDMMHFLTDKSEIGDTYSNIAAAIDTHHPVVDKDTAPAESVGNRRFFL